MSRHTLIVIAAMLMAIDKVILVSLSWTIAQPSSLKKSIIFSPLLHSSCSSRVNNDSAVYTRTLVITGSIKLAFGSSFTSSKNSLMIRIFPPSAVTSFICLLMLMSDCPVLLQHYSHLHGASGSARQLSLLLRKIHQA